MLSQNQNDSASAPLAISLNETSARSVSNYIPMSSPRSALTYGQSPFSSESATDRQLVARERHQWKRCVGGHHVRWVCFSLHFETRCVLCIDVLIWFLRCTFCLKHFRRRRR